MTCTLKSEDNVFITDIFLKGLDLSEIRFSYLNVHVSVKF